MKRSARRRRTTRTSPKVAPTSRANRPVAIAAPLHLLAISFRNGLKLASTEQIDYRGAWVGRTSAAGRGHRQDWLQIRHARGRAAGARCVVSPPPAHQGDTQHRLYLPKLSISTYASRENAGEQARTRKS